MTYTAEQKIDRAHFYIMNSRHWIAYSGVIMVGKVEISDEPFMPNGMPFTAYTDGFNVVYGRAFIEGLTEPEVRMVVLHECLHKMYHHLRMWFHLFQEDPGRANIAADHFVNLTIQESGDPGVVMPKIGIQPDPKYTNMTVAEIFKLLPPPPPCPYCQSGEDHPEGMQSGPGGMKCEQQQSMDGHGWEEAKDVSKEEQKTRQEQMDAAIRQGAVLAGKMAGNQPRAFDGLLDVPIDWREVLRQFVSAYCKGGDFASFRRPNRRWIQHGLYMPSTISETIDSSLFGMDMSGSIGGPVVQEFVSAGVSALEQVNPARMDLLYWDHVVAAHEVYFQGDARKMLTSTRPKGGGGTSPSCITAYMKEHHIVPTCAVILTDGYVGNDWGGEWPCPVLWVIKDNKSAVPTVGSVVHF